MAFLVLAVEISEGGPIIPVRCAPIHLRVAFLVVAAEIPEGSPIPVRCAPIQLRMAFLVVAEEIPEGSSIPEGGLEIPEDRSARRVP